jgi:hypothetical protein
MGMGFGGVPSKGIIVCKLTPKWTIAAAKARDNLTGDREQKGTAESL